MRLIIGPTSAGKSSYIQGLTGEDAAKPKVYFAHQLQKSGNIPTGDNDVVHYNLLHGVKGRREAARLGESELLHNLIDAASDVVVLSAPRSVLLERSGSRVLAEPDHPGHAKRRYDQEVWEKALRAPDLAQVYEHLGLLLDEAKASHEYFCTNVDVHGEITPIARWDFPQLAREDAQELCRKGHRLPEQAEQRRSYQSDHRIGGVSATLSHALVMPLENKKVLDIGCAEGAVALSAARMGARVTGLEPRQGRLTKARRAAKGMGLDVEFRKGFLDSLESRPGTFDVVLALNVVHHVPNPFGFLDQAASLTRSHLVLEYPGLVDEKYRRTLPDGTPGLDDTLPLVGVSTRAEDQTFVFTPAGLERYFLDTVRVFTKHRVVPSPMPNRWLSIFSGKDKSVAATPTAAILKKRIQRKDARIAELEQRLAEIEGSRSWKVTAPIRKVTGKVRPS